MTTITKRQYLHALSLFTLLFTGLLLFGPRVANDQMLSECVTNLDLPGPFGISLNCDSPDFLLAAAHPSLLLKEKKVRQSRPGLILAAYALSKPFVPVLRAARLLLDATPFERVFAKELNGRALFEVLPAYLAYLLMNFLLLLSAARLFVSLHKGTEQLIPLCVAALSLLVVANDITKAFFFSPHTQLFNILVPLLCIWGGLKSWDEKTAYQARAFLWAFLLGLGMLSYGTFLVAMPFLLLPAFIREPRWSFLPRSALALLLFLLPTFLWWAFVRCKTGAFYSHEVEQYNHVVWMKQMGSAKAVVAQVINNLGRSLEMFDRLNPGWSLLALTLLTLALAGKALGPRDKVTVCMALGTSAAMALFFSVIGLLAWRTAFAMLPGLWVVLGITVLRITERWPAQEKCITGLSCAAVLAWLVYELAKYGPNA